MHSVKSELRRDDIRQPKFRSKAPSSISIPQFTSLTSLETTHSPVSCTTIAICRKCGKETKCIGEKLCTTCRQLMTEHQYLTPPAKQNNPAFAVQSLNSPCPSPLAAKFGRLEIADGVQLYHRDFSLQFFGFQQLLNNNAQSLPSRKPSYVVTTSETRISPVSSYSDLILSFLPSRESTDVMVEEFFTSAPYNHFFVEKDKFYAEYNEFWTASTLDPYFLALLFAMLSFPLGVNGQQTGITDAEQERYKRCLSEASTECLNRGKYLERFCLKVLQVMLVNSFNFWLSTRFSTFINAGMLVSMAHGLGLHRDPTSIYGLEDSEFEIRRRLWFLVVLIDVHFVFAEGLPLHIVPEETDTLPPTYSPERDGNTDLDPHISASVHQVNRALQPPMYENIQQTQHFIRQVDSVATKELKLDEDEKDPSILWEACSIEAMICRAQVTLHLPYISSNLESKQLALDAAIRSMRCFLIVNGRRSEELEKYKWRSYFWMVREVLIAVLLSALLVTSEKLLNEKDVWELIHKAHELLCLKEIKCHLGRDMAILHVIEQLRFDRLSKHDLIKDIQWEWIQSFQ